MTDRDFIFSVIIGTLIIAIFLGIIIELIFNKEDSGENDYNGKDNTYPTLSAASQTLIHKNNFKMDMLNSLHEANEMIAKNGGTVDPKETLEAIHEISKY